MRDMRYTPYRVPHLTQTYSYITTVTSKHVVEALLPIIDFTRLAEIYLNFKGERAEFAIDNIDDITKENVLNVLQNGLVLVCKNATSKVDLFPIEVRVAS